MSLAGRTEGTKVVLLAPLDSEVGSDVPALLRDLQRQGFVRLRVNGELLEVEEAEARWPVGDGKRVDSLEVVVDRLVIRQGAESRLADSVETALRICGAEVMALVQNVGDGEWSEICFPTSYRNPRTGFELSGLSPRHFSFNSHLGACERCHGLGTELFCDPDLVVPDQSKSLRQKAIRLYKGGGKRKSWYERQVEALAEHFGVSGDVPFRELPEEFRSALFHGTGGMKIEMRWEKEGREVPWDREFEGIGSSAKPTRDSSLAR